MREARAFQAQLRRARAAAEAKKDEGDDDDEDEADELAEFESVEASLKESSHHRTSAAAAGGGAAEDHNDHAGHALVWDGDVGGFFRVSKVHSRRSGGDEIGEMLVRFASGHPLRGGEVHGVALEDVVAYPLPSSTDVE